MQVTVNLVFDLGTSAGRTTFARLGQLVESDGQLNLTFPADAPTPAAAPPGNGMTPRQQAAAAARAAKSASKDKPPAPPNGETVIEDPPETTSEDVAGPETKDEDDIGLSPPSMSPAEARDAALAVVREIYAAGKVKEVKDLQKEYGVAKFYDIADERGHEFYRRVTQLAQSVGLRT